MQKPSKVELFDLVRIREARDIEDVRERVQSLVDVFRSLGHEIMYNPNTENHSVIPTLSSLISMYARIAREVYGFSIYPKEDPFIPKKERASPDMTSAA